MSSSATACPAVLNWVTPDLPEITLARRLATRGMNALKDGDYLRATAVRWNAWAVMVATQKRAEQQLLQAGWNATAASQSAFVCFMRRADTEPLNALMYSLNEALKRRHGRDPQILAALSHIDSAQKTAWEVYGKEGLKAANGVWPRLFALPGMERVQSAVAGLLAKSGMAPKLLPHEVACERCGGAGFVSQWKYIEDSPCSDCGGSGRELDTWRGDRLRGFGSTLVPITPRAVNSKPLQGLLLGPLLMLGASRGRSSEQFGREVRATLFAIGLSNTLTSATQYAATALSRR